MTSRFIYCHHCATIAFQRHIHGDMYLCANCGRSLDVPEVTEHGQRKKPQGRDLNEFKKPGNEAR